MAATTTICHSPVGAMITSTIRLTNQFRSRRTARMLGLAMGIAFVPRIVSAQDAHQDPPALTQTMKAEHGISISYSESWSLAPREYTNVHTLLRVPPRALGTPASVGAPRIMIHVEYRRDHAEGVRRLKEIEAERETPATFMEIGGWPAVQRRYEVLPERPSVGATEVDSTELLSLRVTTAIAFGDLLVRIEGALPPGEDPKFADDLEAIGRSAVFPKRGNPQEVNRQIHDLQNTPRLFSPQLKRPDQGAGILQPEESRDELYLSEGVTVGPVLRVQNGADHESEIEIAVSTDGKHIVVANNSRDYATSNDHGQSFPTTGVAPPVTGGTANGDPSLAYGASGNFYFAYIGFPPGNQCSTGITRSTDNGQTFDYVANATVCDDDMGEVHCFPDQEHIAADRINLSGTMQDQVYSTWRDFTGGGCDILIGPAGPVVPTIVCSTDSGATWTAKAAVAAAGEFPRITVGQDGFVYVVYRSGASIMLNKFSSCGAGLTQQVGFPVTVVAGISDVACPVPGLDRCNLRNVLSSQMVAVDDTDASHVFVAYAVNTVAPTMAGSYVDGNENVLVQDSTDGGATWPAAGTVQVNAAVTGRRFMPWVCSTSGAAYVTWFDMRAATMAQNDEAEFYCGTARREAGGLTAGAELKISTVSDNLCASGWPTSTQDVSDSESCSAQPQLAGSCVGAGGPTGVPCDFSNCGTANCGAPMGVGGGCECNAGETCQCGGGSPKYGDYNGNACVARKLYTAWASATSPPGINPASTSIDAFFRLKDTNPPIPAISEWGAVIMTLLFVSCGTIIYRGRRSRVC